MVEDIHLDYETFSKIDIKSAGHARYAADESTEILIAAVALGDGPVLIWLHPSIREFFPNHHQSKEAETVMRKWSNPNVRVYAHNAPFESFISRFKMLEQMGIAPPSLDQWRCTAAMGRRAALPNSLDKLAAALNLDEQKDKEGSRLIKMFSEPQAKGVYGRIYPEDEPEEFKKFIGYCRQDVVTERAIHRKLSAFEMAGATLEAFQFDMRLNHTGVPVNVPALKKAKVIVDKYQAYFRNEYRTLTGLNPTQTVKSLEWFRERGYPYKNMQALNVDKALDDDSWCRDDSIYEALEYKKMSSYAAVSKIDKMLETHVEGYVYGTHMFYGAGTGRWSGKIIQPQNFKRPSIKNTELAYKYICEGIEGEDLEVLFGNPLEVLSSCIRHFIQWEGGNLLDADYAAIEARIVCWLAGQEDALDRFRKGVDSYVDMASVIFGKHRKDIDSMERWMGKQTVLGCGFQMGKAKFYDQCVTNAEKFGMDIVVTKTLAAKSVEAFRSKYNKVSNLWHVVDACARKAILNPGCMYKAGELLSFTTVVTKGMRFLVMKLPSGRNIVYPDPKIELVTRVFENEDGTKSKQTKEAITFFGQLPKKQTWGRVSTYGGKLVENATQGTAADVMGHGAVNATRKGFTITTLIHDEALAFDEGQSIEYFCECLSLLPDWAAGLPIVAEGEVIPFYKKT